MSFTFSTKHKWNTEHICRHSLIDGGRSLVHHPVIAFKAYACLFRYNANRAPQAQSKIKVLEKLPVLEPPEEEESMRFKFAEADRLSPPLLQLDEASFGYSPEKLILKGVSIDVDTDSRHGIIGPNG